NNSELYEELSELIQNFGEMNTKNLESIVVLSSKQENFSLSKRNLNKIVDKIYEFIFKIKNKIFKWELEKQRVIEHFNNYNINSHEIYNWLLNNQSSSNSIFLLGYFNFYS